MHPRPQSGSPNLWARRLPPIAPAHRLPPSYLLSNLKTVSYLPAEHIRYYTRSPRHLTGQAIHVDGGKVMI